MSFKTENYIPISGDLILVFVPGGLTRTGMGAGARIKPRCSRHHPSRCPNPHRHSNKFTRWVTKGFRSGRDGFVRCEENVKMFKWAPKPFTCALRYVHTHTHTSTHLHTNTAGLGWQKGLAQYGWKFVPPFYRYLRFVYT